MSSKLCFSVIFALACRVVGWGKTCYIFTKCALLNLLLIKEAAIVVLIGEACLDAGQFMGPTSQKRKVFQRKIIVFTIRWRRTKYCCEVG